MSLAMFLKGFIMTRNKQDKLEEVIELFLKTEKLKSKNNSSAYSNILKL